MKKILFAFFIFSLSLSRAQSIFSNSYGNPQNPAIVFLHGGPGYNAVSFELGAMVKLAEAGYYVITFDQRGCGRSKKDSIPSHYTFNHSNEDINLVLKKYNVTQAYFIGHSWGGTLAIKYAESFPEKVKGIILLSAPLNYQLVFKSIIEKCEKKCSADNNTTCLKQINNVKQLDTTKLDYSSLCFLMAMNNGLYKTKENNPEQTAIFDEMKKNKKFEYLSKMSSDPIYGFWLNEQYTTLDMRYYLKKVQDKNIPVYAIYGDEDGLFNQTHFDMIKNAVGPANYTLIKQASHNVFVDQRSAFIRQVKKYFTPPPEEKKPVKK